MTATAAVTMLMPVRNGERFIGAALDSLLAQTFRDFTVIVIDDGSTDRTREVVAAVRDRRVRLLSQPLPLGPAAARNRGLEESRSRYVGFLDSDDLAEPHRLERQMAFLRQRPDVGLVAAQASIIDEQGHRTGEVWGWVEPDDLIAPRMCFRNWLPTSTIMLDRDALGEERFDPTLEVASDYDMWLKVIARTGVASLRQPLSCYRIHPSNLTHQRRVAAEPCLQRIAHRQLGRLGVVASPAEMTTHRRLAAGTPEATPAFVAAAAEWLSRLERANVRARVYAAPAFAAVIADEWLSVCDAAARGGSWHAWPAIVRSPLTRRLAVSRRGVRGLAPLAWRTLRAAVRRRWPALGPALRASNR